MGLLGPMAGADFLREFVLMGIIFLLSLIGATGILISFRRFGQTGIWAVPALIVTFSLLMGTLGQFVLEISSNDLKISGYQSFLSNVITCIYIFGTLASSAFIFFGYGQSGCKSAGITAAILGIFGVLSIPFVIHTLSQATRTLEGIPVRSEEPVVGLLYVVFIMPVLGFVILVQTFHCIHNHKIKNMNSVEFRSSGDGTNIGR